VRYMAVIHHWDRDAQRRQDVRAAMITVSNVTRKATMAILVFVGTSAITTNEST
jgi:hypothetical protein